MNNNHSKLANPTIPHADTQGKEASTSDKQKEIIWNTQVMQMPHLNSSLEEEPNEESNYPQFMEEERESIDIGELDIPGLEKACITNNFDNIPGDNLRIWMKCATENFFRYTN